MFAGIMTLAVVTNIDLVKGVQNLWTQTGNVITLTNGANRTLQVEGTLQTDGAISSQGQLTSEAGIKHSYTNSTSTSATTQTLLAGDIMNYESVIMEPTVGAVTFTFPASSTLSAMVPVAGDWFDQVWYNASTTASQTITLSAGTGIDLEISTSSTNALIINPSGSATLRYFRQPATASTFDISVLMTHFDDAD